MEPAGFSVLVADENDLCHAEFRNALTPAGYDVLAAKSGRETVEIIRNKLVHVVVMDIRLPDYSGLEIYHAIKAIRDVFLPCIFTAMELTPRWLERALNEDAITILPKPVDETRLVHAVDWSIRRYYPHGARPMPGQWRRRL